MAPAGRLRPSGGSAYFALYVEARALVFDARRLTRALELAAPSKRAAIHVELAVLAAGDDDLHAVADHAAQALQSDAPAEIVRDILRARPQLRRPDVAAALAQLLGPEDRIGVGHL